MLITLRYNIRLKCVGDEMRVYAFISVQGNGF
jgi:hypothetical protein